MTLAVRVYAAEKKARDAAEKLKAEGFSGDKITVLAGKADADPSADVAAAVTAGLMPGAYAGTAAATMKKGRAIVAVDAPFGAGGTAERILDGFGPVQDDLQISTTGSTSGNLTTEGWGPLLSERRFFLFNGELINSASRTELMKDPAPLSSRLGLRILTEPKKDWTQSFGQSLLSTKRFIFGEPKLTPKKYAFGEPKLTNKYTAGEPQLTSDAAPFSKTLGQSVLKD